MYDLANYLNEIVFDNAHPSDNGIKFYIDNFPTDQEITYLIKCYLECYHKHLKSELTFDEFFEARIAKYEKEIRQCMLLSNYKWAVWSFMMLRDENIKNDKAFNYYFASERAQL
jgi:thiamine kinase-like enzyme